MCNCQGDIEDKLKERFIEENPSAIDHRAVLMGYALMLGKTLATKGYMEFELTAKFRIKNKPELKEKKQKSNITFNYCPFCGEKYPAN
ncbi:MAG: hypothetical protein Q8M20_17980 [Rhodocyclaceae bacterium]|nr:hypothetical protein [Rhodocyclaceae bacterium]